MSRGASAAKSANFSTINVENFQPFLSTKTSKNSHGSLSSLSDIHTSCSPNLDSPLLTSSTSALKRESEALPTHNTQHAQSPRLGVDSSSPTSLHETNPILTFNANFESGNLGSVQAVNHFEYNLEIRQDTNNQKFRLWYYFSVEGFKKNQVALFNILNFSKGRSLYRTGQTPLVKINDGKWNRLNPNDCWYYRPDKNSCYCLSFLFKFPDLPPKRESAKNPESQSHQQNQPASAAHTHTSFANISVPPDERNTSDSYPFAARSFQNFGHRPATVSNRNKIYFAYCFPYTYTKLQNFLTKITDEPKNAMTLQRELVSMTAQRRRVELLTISSPQNLQKMAAIENQESSQRPSRNHSHMSNFSVTSAPSGASDRATDRPPPLSVPASFVSPTSSLISSCNSYIPVVFVSARVHPGETPSSWAMEEFIKYLLSNDGKHLRNVAVFKIVPMINPDGVAVGNYRCSTYGYDLNRCYQDPSAWAMPEIYGIKDVIEKYLHKSDQVNSDQNSTSASGNLAEGALNPSPLAGNTNPTSSRAAQMTLPKAKLELYVDLHGHSLLPNSFMYGNLFEDDPDLSEKQHILPKIMDKISQDFSIKNSNFNCDSCKSGSARRTFESFSHLLCYTLEISMSHYFSKFSSDGMFYSESRYLTIGTNLARAMEHYFCIRKPGRKSIPKSSLTSSKSLVL